MSARRKNLNSHSERNLHLRNLIMFRTLFCRCKLCSEQHAGRNIFSSVKSTKETFFSAVEICAKVCAENDDSNKHKVADARGEEKREKKRFDGEIERWYNSTFIAANSLK